MLLRGVVCKRKMSLFVGQWFDLIKVTSFVYTIHLFSQINWQSGSLNWRQIQVKWGESGEHLFLKESFTFVYLINGTIVPIQLNKKKYCCGIHSTNDVEMKEKKKREKENIATVEIYKLSLTLTLLFLIPNLGSFYCNFLQPLRIVL